MQGMKWALIIGAVMLVLAGTVFALVARTIYVAYTDPLCTEFGPVMVIMALPITIGAAFAWAGVRLLGPKPPA
jgi:hypothetical protein